MPPQNPQQPMQPSSPMQAPPEMPAQSPPPMGFTPQPAGKPSGRRYVLVVLVIVLLGGMLGGLGFWLYNKKSSHTPKTDRSVLNTLQNPSLTTADLVQVNKEDAFYAYLERAAQEQKMTITKAYYFSDDGAPKAEDRFSRVGVDYQTKKITYAYERAEASGRSRYRCLDGQQYSYVYEWIKEDAPTDCRQDKLYANATDGFNAGGLTAGQAEVFASYLRGKTGLITVEDMKLESHAGKQYVHFSVKLQQIRVKDTEFAAQWLMFAFKETGLNPDVHPYGYAGAGGQGFKLDYYVDPATRLPAYSEITSLPHTDETNKNDKSTYHYKVQYDFTRSTFDASTANNADIALTW